MGSRFSFDLEDEDYLTGLSFSNGRTFVGEGSPMQGRIEAVIEAVKNKRVLHIGFADHDPLINAKRQARTWLHDRITEVAICNVGVDSNQEVVSRLSAEGVGDIYSFDIAQKEDVGRHLDIYRGESQFDVVVLGEVLEHIGNPVNFLAAIRENVGFPGQKIFITVPNALELNNFLRAFRNSECVNTDHRFWFTPYTLARVLSDAGYQVLSVDTCAGGDLKPKSVRGRAYWKLMSIFGLLLPHVTATGIIPPSAAASSCS